MRQEWRDLHRRWAKPICPACTAQGWMLCARCLRWFCREHYAEHDKCVYEEINRTPFIKGLMKGDF